MQLPWRRADGPPFAIAHATWRSPPPTTIIRRPPAGPTAASGWPSSPTRAAASPTWRRPQKNDFRSLVPTGNGDQIRLVHVRRPAVVGAACRSPSRCWISGSPRWPSTAPARSGSPGARTSAATGTSTAAATIPAAGSGRPIERITTEPGADINVVSAHRLQGQSVVGLAGAAGQAFPDLPRRRSTPAPADRRDRNPANHWDPAHRGRLARATCTWPGTAMRTATTTFSCSVSAAAESEPVIPVATTSDLRGPARAWRSIARTGSGSATSRAGRTGARISAGWSPIGRLWAARTSRYARGRPPARARDGVGIPLYKIAGVVVQVLRRRPAATARRRSGRRPGASCRGRRVLPGWRSADDGRLWLLFRHHPLPSGGGKLGPSMPCPTTARPGASRGCWPIPTTCWTIGRRSSPSAPTASWPFTAATPAAGREQRGERPDAAEERLYAACCAATARWSRRNWRRDAARPGRPCRCIRTSRKTSSGCASSAWNAAGKTYQLVRGEFHRHTEYTAHGDGDGSLEDMWRYSQDAADMDWMGNADHDNGFGHQYAWWTIQKTMDIYHNPPWFVAPFTYERSVNYPNGHRNVIFAQRGIRTLPRGDMNGRRADRHSRHQDALCLPEAFRRHLRQPHQRHRHGHRLARQRPAGRAGRRDLSGRPQQLRVRGAPRGFDARDGRRTTEPGARSVYPKGFVWNALAKGYRFGFESSSDHVSTHSSYGIALVEQPGREALLEAFRARRCYRRHRQHPAGGPMRRAPDGRGVRVAGKPTLEIHAVGTAPIAKLDIVRNNQYVYSAAPNTATSTCSGPTPIRRRPAASYYYVRIQQADTNLAWSSPMWIHDPPKEP